jgi:CubicO group peptidase (beta-lactamase class C family)
VDAGDAASNVKKTLAGGSACPTSCMMTLMRRLLWLSWAGFAIALAQAPRLDPAAIERVATEELRSTKTPGAAVAVIAGNRMIFSHGYGVSSIESGAPVTPDMLFRLGSTTKMFTASTVTSLALEGKLDLNAPVGRYIHGLDPAIAKLTANQLLSHTAGLKDEAPMFGSHDEAALGAGIREWKSSFLFTDPGRIYSYSNPGYWLAGYLAETVAGKPYADVVEERVFRPLGMTRSTFRPTMAMTWPLAQGHEVKDDKPSIIRPAADNAGSWPAGSMFSNVFDLSRFVLAFLDSGKSDGKQALPPELISTLSSRHFGIPGSTSAYGYGLTISRERGVTWLKHGGSRAGYGSTIEMVPDQNFGVVIVANRTGSGLPKLADAISEMFLDLEPSRKDSSESLHALSREEIARYAGTYGNGDQRIVLRAEEGGLTGDIGASHPKFTKAGKDFIVNEAAGNGGMARVVGVASGDGEMEYLHVGGRSYKRVR